MTIRLTKLIFSLSISLTSFYISLSNSSYSTTKIKPTYLPRGGTSSIFGIYSKILLDLKYKIGKHLFFTRDISSVAVDIEGKIIGCNNLNLLTPHTKMYLKLASENSILKKTILFGSMKFIQV